MIAGISSLVVEDEYIIALEIQRVLESASATAIIATPDAAGGASRTFDLAVIAVPPDRPALVELCRNLGNRGIAVVAVTSGCEPEGGGPAANVVGVEIADVFKYVAHQRLPLARLPAFAGLPAPSSSAALRFGFSWVTLSVKSEPASPLPFVSRMLSAGSVIQSDASMFRM